MKINKTYIIYIETPMSREYADHTIKSCKELGIEYELFEGYKPKDQRELWKNFKLTAGISIPKYKPMAIGAAGCTASHAHLWKQIADKKECAVILEHDGMMLHPVEIDIPDDKIVALGYKYYDWDKYDYKKAGPPQKLVDVKFNPGSHGDNIPEWLDDRIDYVLKILLVYASNMKPLRELINRKDFGNGM